jgi:hypothetical protein
MEEATDLGMSSVCVSDETNIEDIKSGKFHLIFGSAENVLHMKCSVDALKYSSCHLRNRLVAFVIDESHVIETWTGERKIQIQNAHFIFMHVPHNLSDHSGPLSQTISIFCKRTSKLSCPTVGLSKFTIETDFHVSPYVLLEKYCYNGKIRSHVQRFFACKCFLSFFPTPHYTDLL